jgi:uncharacterized NAD(P)/FAD-binding protein YdhS
VLVLGTGLTAVDVVLGLRHRGHEGRVIAVSRHGFLPRVHAFAAPRPAPAWELPATASLGEVVAEVRRQLARTGGDFRLVVDGLRGRTQSLWRALTPADRARFLRHLQPFWTCTGTAWRRRWTAACAPSSRPTPSACWRAAWRR